MNNYDLANTDSCHIISIESLEFLQRRHYALSCGELLNVGDEFLQIGSKATGGSSAGFGTIRMAHGWRQRMEGLFSVPRLYCSDDRITDFILMSAWDDAGNSALAGLKMEHKYNFMAYLPIGGGDLHFTSKSGSGRYIKCDRIVRHQIESAK